MKRALVTGGAGFVGSALAHELIKRGVDVVVLDDLSTGKLERLYDVMGAVNFVEGSILDTAVIAHAMEGIDTVFHCAALVSVPESIKDPVRAQRVNEEGTKRILNAARNAGVLRFIYASSAAVYGNPTQLPLVETMPLAPLSPYGATKRAGEEYVRAATGITTVSLRYMNIVGMGQDPRSPYAAVVSLFLDRARHGKSIRIEGDGEQTRDFVALQDVVAANIRAAEADLPSGAIFNIGTGIETSVNDVVRVLERELGKSLTVEHGDPRPGDIRRSVADSTAARRDLGWSPQVSFDAAIRSILEG